MTFFFDNNIGPSLAAGLHAFGEDVCHLTDHLPPDTTDEVWLGFVGQRGMFLVTRDMMIRKRPSQLEALKRHNVGAFFLVGKKMGKWDQIRQIIHAWPAIKETASKTRPPFAFLVRRAGNKIVRLPLP
jgi:hypothetical protein